MQRLTKQHDSLNLFKYGIFARLIYSVRYDVTLLSPPGIPRLTSKGTVSGGNTSSVPRSAVLCRTVLYCFYRALVYHLAVAPPGGEMSLNIPDGRTLHFFEQCLQVM